LKQIGQMKDKVSAKKKWDKPSVKELIINSQTTNGKGMGQEVLNVKKGTYSNGSYQ